VRRPSTPHQRPKTLRASLVLGLIQECDSLDERLKNHTADGEALSLNIARESAGARINRPITAYWSDFLLEIQ